MDQYYPNATVYRKSWFPDPAKPKITPADTSQAGPLLPRAPTWFQMVAHWPQWGVEYIGRSRIIPPQPATVRIPATRIQREFSQIYVEGWTPAWSMQLLRKNRTQELVVIPPPLRGTAEIQMAMKAIQTDSYFVVESMEYTPEDTSYPLPILTTPKSFRQDQFPPEWQLISPWNTYFEFSQTIPDQGTDLPLPTLPETFTLYQFPEEWQLKQPWTYGLIPKLTPEGTTIATPPPQVGNISQAIPWIQRRLIKLK